MNRKIILSLIVVILTASILACQLTGLAPTSSTAPTPTMSAALTPAQPVDLASQQDKLVSLFQAVSPGVVTVQTSTSIGSGWVYSMDGYIVTNAHVVGSETKVEADFPTGNKVYGKVVGADQNSDLAVIKVDVPAAQLHPLALGDSDSLKVGQIDVVIGDPLAEDGTTMTSGVIAGLGRSQPSGTQASGGGNYQAGDFIETDALINPGNSGGPLLDLNGQVIGVIRSISVDPTSGVSSGLGFAISINVVKRVVPELIQNGKFDYPYMGLGFLPDVVTPNGGLTLELINVLGLKSTYGAYVISVTPGGPGDKAGLRAGTTASSIQGLNSGGDLIIAVDGLPVQGLNDLMRYIVVRKSPGDTITLTVMRGDQKTDVKLTLGVRP